ncbi:MAG: T9SS type A sorting domain-containing protein [Muribaculaceae bacterium]|nr:T9SS type A sorting domain-containing protein [Muribaculaceae bacterium]
MIRKISVCAGLLMAIGMNAQVMEKYPGFLLSQMSDNGRYLVSTSGVMAIFDRQTSDMFPFSTSYAVGLGNAVSDTGIVVGMTDNFRKACYWAGDKWNLLPMDTPNPSYAMANAITPDGRYIVGSVDCSAITGNPLTMVSPVIWTWDEASESYQFGMLPCPESDVTGSVPQQVSATFVSADGKVVLGQVTDYRGMIEYQIVYTLDDNGDWNYITSGTDRIVKDEDGFLPFPERPVMPQSSDYLTDEEKMAFNKANQAYKDSLEIVSLTGINPRMPWYEDFIEERREEYEAAMEDFKARSESFNTDFMNYSKAYTNNLTGHMFEFNSHKLSRNGRYYTANYSYPDPEATDLSEAARFMSPIFYDIDNVANPSVMVAESMGTYSICNDGMMAVASPRTDEKDSRVPSLIFPGKSEPVLLSMWLKENHPEVYDWIAENMAFDTDEEGHPVTDDGAKVFLGTVRMSPDASRYISYCHNPATGGYVSYFVDFNANTDGVEGVDAASGRIVMAYDRSLRMLCLSGEIRCVEVYDMAGQRVKTVADPAATVSLDGLHGLYVVRAVGSGSASVIKIACD